MATSAIRTDARQRLLDGLAASVREKGLARTGIGDIVRHARTSNRTFYECFPDKESAFVELIRTSSVGLFASVEMIVEVGGPWEERVEQAVHAYLQALTDDPMLVAAISRELPALGERGAALQREALDRFADLFVRISHEPEIRAAGGEALVCPVDIRKPDGTPIMRTAMSYQLRW